MEKQSLEKERKKILTYTPQTQFAVEKCYLKSIIDMHATVPSTKCVDFTGLSTGNCSSLPVSIAGAASEVAE